MTGSQVRYRLFYKTSDYLCQESVKVPGVLHHEEVPNSRHEQDLDAVTLECFYVSRPIVRIDGHDRRLQISQILQEATRCRSQSHKADPSISTPKTP